MAGQNLYGLPKKKNEDNNNNNNNNNNKMVDYNFYLFRALLDL